MYFPGIERARMHPVSQPHARVHYARGLWMTVGSNHALRKTQLYLLAVPVRLAAVAAFAATFPDRRKGFPARADP